MIPVKKDLTILRGKTFDLPIKWETDVFSYAAITGITNSAPCIVTAPSHGVPDGWRVALVSVKGMTQINAKNSPPKDSDYIVAKLLTSSTVELNTVNSANYKPWTSGGYLQFHAPQDLTNYAARMSIKDKIASTTAKLWAASTVYAAGTTIITSAGKLLVVSTAGTSDVVEPSAAGLDGSVVWADNSTFVGSKELMYLTDVNLGILLDNTTKTIKLDIDAVTTAALAWTKGVYDLELVSPIGEVAALLYGSVTVIPEVTT